MGKLLKQIYHNLKLWANYHHTKPRKFPALFRLQANKSHLLAGSYELKHKNNLIHDLVSKGRDQYIDV